MKHVKRLLVSLLCILSIASLSACGKTATTIPTVNETSLEDTASALGVSTETFNDYLVSMDMTFDDYIDSLNENNLTIETMKNSIEKNYGCTYDEYVRTIIAITNTDIPDAKSFDSFLSQYSLYDAYFSKEDVSYKNDSATLLDGTVTVEVADNSQYAYAFDVMSECSNNFRLYTSALNSAYGCLSVEFTNMTLLGGLGVTKPDTDNKCMDALFVYDKTSFEILEPIVAPVMTMHFEDENKNITLLLSDELGLVFKTEGADSFEKMKAVTNIEFQIRNANLSSNDTASTESTTSTATTADLTNETTGKEDN